MPRPYRANEQCNSPGIAGRALAAGRLGSRIWESHGLVWVTGAAELAPEGLELLYVQEGLGRGRQVVG